MRQRTGTAVSSESALLLHGLFSTCASGITECSSPSRLLRVTFCIQ